MWVCNATAALPPDCDLRQLARIEALVLLCSVVLALLVFLGSSRRYSSSAMVRFILWGAFAVSYPLAAYTIGLMQSTPMHHELFLVWSCFFLFVLASSDTITAYSLADVKSPGIILLNRGLQVIYVTVLLQYYSNVLSAKLKLFVFGVWLVSLGKIALSALSYRQALQSDGLQRDNQLIADYMINQTESSHGGAEEPDTNTNTNPNPNPMLGYNYIVRGEEMDITVTEAPDYIKKIKTNKDDKKDKLVTVERVWQCEGRLLQRSKSRRDLCLSFALFKLLRRRCGNFPLAESGLAKTRNLVLNRLLGQGSTRAFQVIEVELGFLYDLFYTRYPFVCHAVTTTLPHLAMCAIMVTVGVLTLLSPALRHYHPTHHRSIMLYDINLDVVLTMAIIVLVIVLEAYQFVAVLFSDWQKVKVLCRYVLWPSSLQNNPFIEVLLGVLCYCGSGKYWTRKMRQYSIIRHAILGHPVKDWLSGVTRGWLDNLMFNNGKTRSVKLSGDLQDALASALKKSGGVLSDGCASLKGHKFEQMLSLGKACKHATCAHTILIWHIATYICDVKTRARASRAAAGDQQRRHREIALSLSGYCAYLVSSAPELLPDHQYTTQTIAEAVLLDLRLCLHGCTSNEAAVLKLQDTAKLAIRTPSTSAPDSIHVLGVRLAEDLMKIGEAKRWEVLADFWAELMLFVTPADNAMAHVEHLTMGGELITHLWALLTHAGIVQRPSHATQPQSV
uniref:DUF4220 domain-containing protein n=1 Tax=Oryza glumipatula TaxID=40148 RepID=A0A0D9YQV8_9ORYZ